MPCLSPLGYVTSFVTPLLNFLIWPKYVLIKYNKKQIWGKFTINLRSGEFLGIFANFLGIFGKNFLVTLKLQRAKNVTGTMNRWENIATSDVYEERFAHIGVISTGEVLYRRVLSFPKRNKRRRGLMHKDGWLVQCVDNHLFIITAQCYIIFAASSWKRPFLIDR